MAEKHKRSEFGSPKKGSEHEKSKFDELVDAFSSDETPQSSCVNSNGAIPGLPPGDDMRADPAPPAWFAAFERRLDKRFEQLTLYNEHQMKEVKELKKQLDVAFDKIDDLENRSRRNNLVFFNIPEGVESKSSCEKYISSLITQAKPSLHVTIQRAHRTPTGPARKPRSGVPLRPRPIHVSFGLFQERKEAKKACSAAFKASLFHERKLFVGDDLSKRIQQQRKALLPTLKNLRESGKKAWFVYPATIIYVENDLTKKWSGQPEISKPKD